MYKNAVFINTKFEKTERVCRMEYLVVFIFGMTAYPILEIVWRGYTHITMAFAGGICLSLIYYVSLRFEYLGNIVCALIGCGIITAVELIFGLVFNVAGGMNIWDYSSKPLNFMGQICAEYILWWFALCLVIMPLCRAAHRNAV